MNPLLHQALSSVLRHFLTAGAGYFVTRGIWGKQEAESYVGALVLFLLSFFWSLSQKYFARLKLESALELPAGATEAEAHAMAKARQTTLGPLTGATKPLDEVTDDSDLLP